MRQKKYAKTAEAVEYQCPGCKEKDIVGTPSKRTAFSTVCACGYQLRFVKVGDEWAVQPIPE